MKENSILKLSLKGFTKYLTASFLSFILFFFLLIGFNEIWVRIIIQVVSLVITCGILYQVYWVQGNKDINYINRNLIKKDKFKGLKSGLLVICPNIIMWIALIICKLIHVDFVLIYKFLNPPILVILNSIFAPPNTEVMKSITYTDFVGFLPIILSVLLFLYIPVVAHVGYNLGLKQYSIRYRIMYQKKKKD